MRNTSSLDALLPKTRQGILAATLVQPEKAWYVSELARRMEVPPSSLQRELQDLTDACILKGHRQGGTAAPAVLAVPPRHAREILGREINPTVYSPAEFVRKRAAKDHFLTRVLAKPKLLVLGTEDELGKATG
jgi:hypothetical protein